jgi:hypothetical protein
MIGPIVQDQSYHRFADARVFLGVANAADTLSNLAFLLVAALGLLSLWRSRGQAVRFSAPEEMRAYQILFCATALTSFGSAYYHLAPSDARLAWDRLPMAVVFMSLLAAAIAERASLRAGLRLLVPFVTLGAASVLYWAASGDLRLYLAVQFGSIAVVLALCVLFASRYTKGRTLLAAAALYGIAKLFELHDREIYELTGHWVSGHTLKHLSAAAAVYLIVWSLERRTACERLVSPPSSGHPTR